jgi:molybdopterin-synthase adenylyltransferase
MWSDSYRLMTDRNIGLLTEDQQGLLKNATVALFGLGGLGGVIGEILVRSGVGAITIVDNDKFEPTNLNRQVFAFQETIGRWKTDATEDFFRKISQEITIEKYKEITTSNVEAILEKAQVAVLAIDTIEPCVIISRAARKLGIPLVEGWAIPYGNTRVFTKDTPTLEEVYGLPTLGKELNAITKEDYDKIRLMMLESLTKIEGVERFYPPLALARIARGETPSFAPIVWLTAVLMALETIKILLQWGSILPAPLFALYNPFDNTIPKQEV